MSKNKIGQRIAIVGLLAFGINTFIQTIPSYSQIVLAADKKTDAKSSDTKKTDAKSSSDSSSTKDTGNDNSTAPTYSNPTKIPMDEYTKSDHYWAWLQYYGPWAEKFGGGPKQGETWEHINGANVGCVATSMAIQAARGGMDINPNDISYSSSVGAGTSVSKGGMTATRDAATGDSGGSLTLSQALEECKKIASSGKYPIARVGQKFGGNTASNSHTMAYWKAGNGTPLWYDPSRYSGGSVWDTKTKINYVGALTITGKGAKKFSENSPSPSGQGASGSSSSSNSKSDDNSGSGDSSSGVGAYKIKPVFNPFYSPAVHYVPADQQSNQNQTNAQIMQTADGMLPTILGSLRVFVGFTAYVYAMLAIIAILIALADLQLGGILQEKILSKSGPMTKALFMPGGKFMGVDDNKGTVVSGRNPALTIVINGTKHYAALLIILTLVASGSMSWIIGNAIGLIGNLFGLG